MATIPGPFGAITSGVSGAGGCSGYVFLGSFAAVSPDTLPNQSIGGFGTSGTFAGMGISYGGAVSSPFVGGVAVSTNDLTGISRASLAHADMGPAKPFIANFSGEGFVGPTGYVYYTSGTISVSSGAAGASSVINSFEANGMGGYLVLISLENAANGESRVLEGIQANSPGESRILYLNQVAGYGKYEIVNSFEQQWIGQYNLEFASIVCASMGSAALQNPMTASMRNYSRVLMGSSVACIGRNGLFAAHSLGLRGYARINIRFNGASVGLHGSTTSFTGIGSRGRSRIAVDSTEGYVVYVGNGQLPDFSAPPAAFSTTLPVVLALDPAITGTITYHIVVRARDKYGLESQNQRSFTITLDTSGNKVMVPIPAVSGVDSGVDAEGNILISGEYQDYNTEDAADKWRIWINSSAIDTSVDVPTLQVDTDFPRFMANIPGYASGTYNYAIALYRTADDSLGPVSTGTVIIVDALPPPVSVGNGFEV